MGVARAEDALVEFPVHSLKRVSGAPAAEGIQVMFEGAVAQGGGVTRRSGMLLEAHVTAVGWACERTSDFEAPKATGP